VETLRCDGNFQLDPSDRGRVEALVRDCAFVYGMGFDTSHFARRFGKPYLPIVEYNLATQIQVARLPVKGTLRQTIRTIKTVWRFLGEIQDLRRGHSVHCNGYPIFEQTRHFNSDCLLYLDSRISEDMVIGLGSLEQRLSDLEAGRPARLLYSGRFEAMKGARDVVEVGLVLRELGTDFELDLYGQGEEAELMRTRVREAKAEDQIRIHDAIPYPELVERSRESDLFVCCHVQDDPSCSYLEAFGSGLPIVGYANRMWSALQKATNVGASTPMKRVEACAKGIAECLADSKQMREDSLRARSFALEHSFEREFAKRIDAIAPLCGNRS